MKIQTSVTGNSVSARITGKPGEQRKNDVIQVKQVAGRLRAIFKQENENEDYTELIFECDNPDAFSIMLINM